MPAAYLAAKSTRREEVAAGDEKKVTVVEENSAPALALAPAPREPSDGSAGCWAPVLIMVAVGTFVWGAIAGQWFDRDGARGFVPFPGGNGDGRLVVGPSYAAPGWVSGASLVVGVLLFVVLPRISVAWRRRTEAGRAGADRAWSAGWYCGRCGSVHFSLGPPLSLHEFRTRVWTAAGYGDLVAKHPVT